MQNKLHEEYAKLKQMTNLLAMDWTSMKEKEKEKEKNVISTR